MLIAASLLYGQLYLAGGNNRSCNIIDTTGVRNENFQATLVLTDTSFDRIKDVQVVRIASEDEE